MSWHIEGYDPVEDRWVPLTGDFETEADARVGAFLHLPAPNFAWIVGPDGSRLQHLVPPPGGQT